MKTGRRSFLGAGLALGALAAGGAEALAPRAEPAAMRLPLWPRGVPEPVPAGLREQMEERSANPAILDRSVKGVTEPVLVRIPASQPNGAAIIAVPGGGYEHLAWDKEGLEIARWFAARGVAGFALSYRLPRDGWGNGLDTPLADLQRSVRLVRGNAARWGLDPDRIAVVGFSAGGHLVANLGAQFDRDTYPAQDDLDRHSAKPCLVAPIYPAVMLDRLTASTPSGPALFGRTMDAETIQRHSPNLAARTAVPPHFLVHAEDDPLVGADHSLALRASLKARGVPVETHLFERGGHGFAIRKAAGLPARHWPDMLLAYGRTTGWIR